MLSLQDVGGDSSDEGEDPANPTTNEELEQDSESEYSEEETDEEVGVSLLLWLEFAQLRDVHVIYCCMFSQTPEAKEELQKRIRVLKKVSPPTQFEVASFPVLQSSRE